MSASLPRFPRPFQGGGPMGPTPFQAAAPVNPCTDLSRSSRFFFQPSVIVLTSGLWGYGGLQKHHVAKQLSHDV